VAAGVFLIFEIASAFIAVPLRELSSILAKVVLDVTGFPVMRHGTILSTPEVTFDVVPACSGSTTLQVLLFLAIVWCGVHPRLTPLRRGAAILLAVPLAILANALRVSALVAAGHILGGEPGGFLHVLAGLAAFALAMLGCFAITDRLASSSKGPAVHDRVISTLLGGLLAFLCLPFLIWCLENWGGRSLDRFGYVFVASAAAVAAWRWRRAPSDLSWERSGTVGFALSFLALAAATLVDVNVLKGLALIMAFLSLSLALKGIRFVCSMVPVAFLAYLGFPTVSYQLGVLTSWRFTSLPAFLGMKVIVGLLLLALLAAPLFRWGSAPSAPGTRRFLPLRLLMAALLAAFQTYYYGVSGTGLQETSLEMSYLQGPWIGRDNKTPGNEEEQFGRGRIWSKRYMRDRDTVDVVVTSTGGDRHRAHPPAYCVTGSGWETVGSEVTERRLGDGRIIPLTLMRLRKDGSEFTFCYWFTNGAQSHASFSGMMLQDTMRRLGGRRADWFVFRILTGSGEAALNDFLSRFQARLIPRIEGALGP
jgi:exosortase/archaeosortase family protein